jgi:hypothetical protein
MFGIPLELVVAFMTFVLVFDILVAAYWDELVLILKAMFFTKKD